MKWRLVSIEEIAAREYRVVLRAADDRKTFDARVEEHLHVSYIEGFELRRFFGSNAVPARIFEAILKFYEAGELEVQCGMG